MKKLTSKGVRHGKRKLARLAAKGARPRTLRRLAARVQRLIEDYQRRARVKRQRRELTDAVIARLSQVVSGFGAPAGE